MMCNVRLNKKFESLSLAGVGMIIARERERERERDNQRVSVIEEKRKTSRFPPNNQSPEKEIFGGIFTSLSEPLRDKYDKYTIVEPHKPVPPMIRK